MFSTFGKKINSGKHLKVLSYTYYIYGGLLFTFVCLFTFTIMRDQKRFSYEKIDRSVTESIDVNQMFYMMCKVNFVVLVSSVLAIVFAYGIKTEQKWAVGFLGYILGLLFLVQFPIGTAVGVYTLWFLVKHEKNK